ncbi:MAG: arabinan endo-1,5-alpha-L-arabinosidase [Actinomycetota bacterium]|nr:arabinan endo-1,5-alpha-L-arabinosidase [Actinomycetota bacterium]
MRRYARGRIALFSSLVTVAAIALCAPAASAYPYPGHVAGDTGIHDPSLLIRSGVPRYTVFGTHNQTRVSTNRVDFLGSGPAIAVAPAWWRDYNPANNFWAPDVSFHNGKYWLYYAVSTFGSQRSAIGLATSVTGDPGTYIDQGIVLTSQPGSRYNAIDPHLFVDSNGRWYLTFGSFWDGIFTIGVDPATGKPSGSTTPLTHLAKRTSGGIEAPVIFKRGGHYYLFVSFDTCCQGTSSTYNVRVGRSTTSTGPYVDKVGTAMLSGGGSLVLSSHDWVRGPGGQSVVNDPADHDLLVYHYYDARRAGAPHLGINFLGWDGAGWPYVW